MPFAGLADRDSIARSVARAIEQTKVTDVHTHLYPPAFGRLMLWGIDELLTYHYLVAETMRWVNLPYGDFWKMSKREQAELIWRTLFLEHSPISESCRGVLTVLARLGLDVSGRSLHTYREFFLKQKPHGYVDRVLEIAGVESLVMTNDPFDESERQVWLGGNSSPSCPAGNASESSLIRDPRFHAALRIDSLLNTWHVAVPELKKWGYEVDPEFGGSTYDEVRRFLREWIGRMKPLYMAVSLPPTFSFPDESSRGRLIENCVLPVCRETGLPFAMMIGVKKLVNPALKLAGDGVGKASIEVVEHLCLHNPDIKFMVTMLSRENQHELCVAARKFRNLLVFGCWWFLNNPSLVEEITRMRVELLGTSFVPQHSDARVLDQLIYKWAHSRKIIGCVLTDKYADLAATGWRISEAEIRRDVADLLGGNLWRFLKR